MGWSTCVCTRIHAWHHPVALMVNPRGCPLHPKAPATILGSHARTLALKMITAAWILRVQTLKRTAPSLVEKCLPRQRSHLKRRPSLLQPLLSHLKQRPSLLPPLLSHLNKLQRLNHHSRLHLSLHRKRRQHLRPLLLLVQQVQLRLQ